MLASEHLVKDQSATQLGNLNEASAVSDITDPDATEQLLAFRIGDEEFGLPVEAVEEVIRVPEKLTRYPGAPAFVDGLMNLRGEVVPVIDQIRRFQGRSRL